MSRSRVCAFIATIRSYCCTRPTNPVWLTRISYHVGRPWMFEGKRFLPDTGTPMRNIASSSSELALADPVPLTLASLSEKSLTLVAGRTATALIAVSRSRPPSAASSPDTGSAPPPSACPTPRWDSAPRTAAVHADVLVLHHHT